jgi:hypothetical protein
MEFVMTFPFFVGILIITTDEVHHFSEGDVNHQPVVTCHLLQMIDPHKVLPPCRSKSSVYLGVLNILMGTSAFYMC